MLIIRDNSGQSTVEAAIMIPLLFLLLLLMIQPGIILYDLVVMNNAASETCRVLSTSNDEYVQKICEPYARRRLAAIPQQNNFHVHDEDCSYEIEYSGNQSSSVVSVKIINQLEPLPIIGFLGSIFGLLNENKCFEISAESTQELKPEWVNNSPQGNNPDNWVGGWLP